MSQRDTPGLDEMVIVPAAFAIYTSCFADPNVSWEVGEEEEGLRHLARFSFSAAEAFEAVRNSRREELEG